MSKGTFSTVEGAFSRFQAGTLRTLASDEFQGRSPACAATSAAPRPPFGGRGDARTRVCEKKSRRRYPVGAVAAGVMNERQGAASRGPPPSCSWSLPREPRGAVVPGSCEESTISMIS